MAKDKKKMSDEENTAMFERIISNKKDKPCPNCGGNKFSKPSVHLVNKGPASDGRLRMSEVVVQFVIGCEECSETIRVLTEDEVTIAPKD